MDAGAPLANPSARWVEIHFSISPHYLLHVGACLQRCIISRSACWCAAVQFQLLTWKGSRLQPLLLASLKMLSGDDWFRIFVAYQQTGNLSTCLLNSKKLLTPQLMGLMEPVAPAQNQSVPGVSASQRSTHGLYWSPWRSLSIHPPTIVNKDNFWG